MNAKQNSQAKPAYNLLTEDQVQEMHRASLHILEEIGVRVLHEDGIALLQQAGCEIKNGNIALIPERLLEACIRSAPASVRIYSQAGEEAMTLEGRRSYFGTGTDLIRTIDLDSGDILRNPGLKRRTSRQSILITSLHDHTPVNIIKISFGEIHSFADLIHNHGGQLRMRHLLQRAAEFANRCSHC